MRRALITGISGFAGSHLADFLVAKGYKVSGIVRKRENPNLNYLKEKIKLYQGEIENSKTVEKILAQEKPDLIFHLAAQSSPRLSFANPQKTIDGNTKPEIYLFESILKLKLKTKVLVIGSSEEYGLVDKKHLPITEETPLNPISPYGVSKVAQDFLGLVYFKTHNLHIVRVRPFNHIGPRQDSSFALASFSLQIAKIEKGKRENVIDVGNIEVYRDFTDVRDMVRAYLLALEKGEPGEVYNIGSGKSYSLREILEKLIKFSGIQAKISVDKKRFRPVDITNFVCDPKKFMQKTDWKPKYTLEETLKFTLEWARQVS